MQQSERVHQVLRYAVAVAAGDDDYRRRELGPIHLVKYLYLADLAYAKKHEGETFSGLAWRFHHFGPWSVDAFREIEPAMAIFPIRRRSFQGNFQDDVIRYRAAEPGLEESTEANLPWEVAREVKKAVHEFSNDTSALLHHVYSTQPMVAAAPGESLDFSTLVDNESQSAREPVASSAKPSKRAQQRRKAAHDELKARFQKALGRRSRRAWVVAEPQPRYDEVFARGQKWLDRQAGEPLEQVEGELIVSDEVWKSPTRTDPGFS